MAQAEISLQVKHLLVRSMNNMQPGIMTVEQLQAMLHAQLQQGLGQGPVRMQPLSMHLLQTQQQQPQQQQQLQQQQQQQLDEQEMCSKLLQALSSGPGFWASDDAAGDLDLEQGNSRDRRLAKRKVVQKAIVNLLASQLDQGGQGGWAKVQELLQSLQPGEASDPNPASSADGGKVAASWKGWCRRCGVQAYRNRGWCDNCGYGQKRKWHGSWEEESKSKRQEQGEQEANKQEVANFEKKEVANFEKKEVAEKKESQQLVNYLLSQGKSEQEAKEEASNFEKMQALQETEEKMAADAVQLAAEQEQKAAAEEKKAAAEEKQLAEAVAKLAEASAKRKAAQEARAAAESAKKAAEEKALQLISEVAEQMKEQNAAEESAADASETEPPSPPKATEKKKKSKKNKQPKTKKSPKKSPFDPR